MVVLFACFQFARVVCFASGSSSIAVSFIVLLHVSLVWYCSLSKLSLLGIVFLFRFAFYWRLLRLRCFCILFSRWLFVEMPFGFSLHHSLVSFSNRRSLFACLLICSLHPCLRIMRLFGFVPSQTVERLPARCVFLASIFCSLCLSADPSILPNISSI